MREYLISMDKIRTVLDLCALCEKYRSDFDTDVKCGRYTVDGASVLGMSSLLGRIVKVCPITDHIPDDFEQKVVSLGGTGHDIH